MVFCGQCGLHLPSGITRCPRCGAVADTTSDANVDTFPTDAPTVASLTYTQRPQASVYPDMSHTATPSTPLEQRKLVLGSGDNIGYGTLADNEPTSALDAADYRTQPPVNVATNTPYTNVPSNANYPVQAGNVYQNGNYTPTGYGHAGNVPPGVASAGYPLSAPAQPKKRRTLPILVALLGLLLVLGVSTFFVVERFHLLNSTRGTNGGIVTPVISPVEQAKSVVQQYYADINNKNYQEAYGLWRWGANAPSFATFENGYVNTEHDALSIRDTAQQSDGTVRVALTIVATERSNSGTQEHTYAGYYIVGQDAGTWKILRGVLARIK